jgi:hypothetical protein
MVIERWHGVHQIRGWQTGLFLLIPVESETGAESRWEEAIQRTVA